jgi:fermentation-respiration switch protein FrsA (DUF1100 family)
MDVIFPLLRILLLGYAATALLALLMADRIIFQPQQPSYRPGPNIVMLTAADGVRIAATYLPNPGSAYTILYSHGNAEDLGDIMPWLRELQSHGFAVCSFDYRGYGLSGGKPTEQGATLDMDAAYNYLTEQLRVPPERIIFHGYSVGGGPALAVASRRKAGGIILESTFTTAFRTVTRLPLLPFDRFRNIDRIGTLAMPVLVIHGRSDTVIPFSHGVRLFAAAQGSKRFLWITGAGHYDLRDKAAGEYWKALRDFTALAGSAREGR